MRDARFFIALLFLSLCLFPATPARAAGGQPFASSNLKSLSLEQLGDVEVTTQSKMPTEVWDTPAAVYVLTQEDIRRSGATTLPDLLRTVPGVEVAELQANQWAVGIRGFGSAFSKDILLLIDGRSTYTPLFEGVYWDVQDVVLDDIDRIEIIRGPGGTVWGSNAVNGVINIVTKQAADTQGVLATGLSGHVDRFNGAVQEGLQHGPNFQYRVFAKGLVREDEQNLHNDPYDQWHLAHGGFRADWNATSRDTITAEGDLYKGASGQQVSIGFYTPTPAEKVVDDTQFVSGGDVLLDWKHRYDGGSSIHTHVYFDRTNRQGQQFGETRNTIDLDFINELSMVPRQSIIWGAGVRVSPSNFIQSQPTVNFAPHQQTDYILSSFLQDTFRLIPNHLDLTLGSKFEENNYSGFVIQPNARLLWNPVPHATLWTAISRAVRTPGRLDQDLQLTSVATSTIVSQLNGNPGFQPEVEIGGEAGYRQLLFKPLYIDIAAFHNQYDALQSLGHRTTTTETTPIAATVIAIPYVNGIKGTTDGIEIAPDWKPTSWWELKGNFSHVHIAMRNKPGFSDSLTLSSYTGSSPHRMATLQSLFTVPHGINLDLTYRFVSRLPSPNGTTAAAVESYQTMDVHTSWEITRTLRLTVAGNSLLQPHHHEFAGDNNNPVGIRRSLYAGLTWTQR